MSLRDWFRRGGTTKQPTVSPGGSLIIRHEGDPPPSAVGFTRQYTAEREVAYRETWGEAETVSHELVPLIPHVDVYVHPPNTERDYYTLVTGGMSDLRMSFPAHASPRRGRAELVLYAREPKPEYIELLRGLAHHPHNTKGWMSHGYTIVNGTPPEPLFEGSELSVVLLIEPIVFKDSMLSELLTVEGDPVDLLWVVPITAAECEVKVQHGTNALMGLFHTHRHRLVLDEGRRSYV